MQQPWKTAQIHTGDDMQEELKYTDADSISNGAQIGTIYCQNIIMRNPDAPLI